MKLETSLKYDNREIPQNSFSTENVDIIKNHIEIFKNSLIPRNLKGILLHNEIGDEYVDFHYKITSNELLKSFFDAFVLCENFTGTLKVESDHFDDNVLFESYHNY